LKISIEWSMVTFDSSCFCEGATFEVCECFWDRAESSAFSGTAERWGISTGGEIASQTVPVLTLNDVRTASDRWSLIAEGCPGAFQFDREFEGMWVKKKSKIYWMTLEEERFMRNRVFFDIRFDFDCESLKSFELNRNVVWTTVWCEQSSEKVYPTIPTISG
jgi:hypothetical protein